MDYGSIVVHKYLSASKAKHGWITVNTYLAHILPLFGDTWTWSEPEALWNVQSYSHVYKSYLCCWLITYNLQWLWWDTSEWGPSRDRNGLCQHYCGGQSASCSPGKVWQTWRGNTQYLQPRWYNQRRWFLDACKCRYKYDLWLLFHWVQHYTGSSLLSVIFCFLICILEWCYRLIDWFNWLASYPWCMCPNLCSYNLNHTLLVRVAEHQHTSRYISCCIYEHHCSAWIFQLCFICFWYPYNWTFTEIIRIVQPACSYRSQHGCMYLFIESHHVLW